MRFQQRRCNRPSGPSVPTQRVAHTGNGIFRVVKQQEGNQAILEDDRKKSILIVDDELAFRELICHWLEDFARRGGHVYLTGDVSYDSKEEKRFPERVEKLAGVRLKEKAMERRVPRNLAQAGREVTIVPSDLMIDKK